MIGEDFRSGLQKTHRVAHHLPECFIREKKMQLKEVEEMSLAKNGEMVRPQVSAVIGNGLEKRCRIQCLTIP